MSANGFPAQRGMPPSSGPSLKRSASVLHESDHEQDTDSHPPNKSGGIRYGPPRPIKKPLPKIFYTEAMVRGAMRGELVYTPALKSLMDSIEVDMRLTAQIAGRHLGSNIHYSKMKSILKQGQDEMINLERYLLSEAFIRTDIWNPTRLQEFFEMVHTYGLERELRDTYWQKNQLAHPAKIQRLYGLISRPLTHPNLDIGLADQIEKWAKDIMSRSVFVPRPDHPIIRSAVAIMNIAEQQSKENIQVWEKFQEGPKRLTQIWIAWCLARNKEWAETTYLAAIILDRGHKNKMIANCFRRENSSLLKLVSNGYDKEACSHWRDMHGKCHVISMQELMSRPVVVKNLLPDIYSASSAERETLPSPTQKKTSSATSAQQQQKAPSLSASLASAFELQKTRHNANKTAKPLPPKVVLSAKAKELASSSQHQLAPSRPTPSKQNPIVVRSSPVSAIGRDRTPEDMVRDLQISDPSPITKRRDNEWKQQQSKQGEKMDRSETSQPQAKKRKTSHFDNFRQAEAGVQQQTSASPSQTTMAAPAVPAHPVTSVANTAASPALVASAATDSAALSSTAFGAPPSAMAPASVLTMASPPPTPTYPITQWMSQPFSPADLTNMVAMRLFSGNSGLSLNGQTVTAKTEREIIEETSDKIEKIIDSKLSPFLGRLDAMSSDVEAIDDKQATFEKTIMQKFDDQKHSCDEKLIALEKTVLKKLDDHVQAIKDQQAASEQAILKQTEDQHTIQSGRQTAFELAVMKKVDEQFELLQKQYEEHYDALKARVDRGGKKRGRPSNNDKAADTITCASMADSTPPPRRKNH
ncbi:hypothetical protein CH063_00244 [Colletotrichum higginsianum]|uniref:Uncharacterized protein n=1 Tax=Colletotrichum higginsianum (strain IMI 349063) TaxID=759273 RepID=H1V9R1_COLHI|nr:hypothetical protein CH63R_11945 [Colletotrichum higginsianum IMI 349063]OBR05242.1 hypothetical protein CH63R_11945 [Colletotrichum higginsianum IMI 349063]CCF36964.1 hypothetical protein CH063_00244 [Colletotrichum higginsianum]